MKMKKLLSLIMAVVLCIPVGSVTTTAKSGVDKNHSVLKEAKKAGYTPIYTIEDLVGINNNPSGNYILMNDIDMTRETSPGGTWDSGHGWTPLNRFSGIFEGNGHRIIGMHIYGDCEMHINGSCGRCVGFFSEIYGGVVQNLALVNCDIDVAADDFISAGGIVAEVGDSHLRKSEISNCYVSGRIQVATTAGSSQIGGIIGAFEDEGGLIANCYNLAEISISNTACSDVGGIVGWLIEGKLLNCYNHGKINVAGIANLGGITGRDGASDYKSYYLNTSASKGIGWLDTDSISGCKALTEAQMSIQSMFAGFDFINTWEIDPNSTYKYPQLKSNRHQRVEGMEIISVPTKITYNLGERIDLSGGMVKLIYEGNYTTTVVMTDNMLENNYNTMWLGEQEVTLQCGGQKATFKIMVQDISASTIDIIGTANELSKGNSMQLNAVVKPENTTDQSLTWSSDNPQIATVDSSGKVTALQVGEVIISATAGNGVSGQYKLKITAACTLLQLNQTELTIYKGDTAVLAATVSPLDTTDIVSWSSSNANIVTVDNNGNLTGCAVGNANITVSAGSKTAFCTVTVKQKLNNFSIIGVVDKEYTGNALEQSVVVTDGNVVLENQKDYTVSYSNNVVVGVAKVCVTGIGYYEGNIEQSFNIVNQGFDVEVTPKPSVEVTPRPSIGETPRPAVGVTPKPSVEVTPRPSIGETPRPSIEVTSKPSDNISIGKVKISKLKNVKGKKLKVTFSKVKGAKGYEIRYSTKSDMAGSKVKRTTKTSYTLSALKKGKSYYVQVRAYCYNNSGKKVYGKWSGKKKQTIKQ